MKENVSKNIQETPINQDQERVTPEIAIKRYCGNCLAADGFDVCTGKGCELYPVTPYRR